MIIFLVLFLIYLTTFLLVASLIGDEHPFVRIYNPFVWAYTVCMILMTSYIARHTIEIGVLESFLIVSSATFLGILHGGLYLLVENILMKNAYNEYYTI